MKKKLNWKTELWFEQQTVWDWKIKQILYNCQELRKRGIAWENILRFI